MKEFNKIKNVIWNFLILSNWFILLHKRIIDLIKNILKWIPNNRMNIDNVLNHLFILIILLVNLFLILITIIVILKYN